MEGVVEIAGGGGGHPDSRRSRTIAASPVMDDGDQTPPSVTVTTPGREEAPRRATRATRAVLAALVARSSELTSAGAAGSFLPASGDVGRETMSRGTVAVIRPPSRSSPECVYTINWPMRPAGSEHISHASVSPRQGSVCQEDTAVWQSGQTGRWRRPPH